MLQMIENVTLFVNLIWDLVQTLIFYCLQTKYLLGYRNLPIHPSQTFLSYAFFEGLTICNNYLDGMKTQKIQHSSTSLLGISLSLSAYLRDISDRFVKGISCEGKIRSQKKTRFETILLRQHLLLGGSI